MRLALLVSQSVCQHRPSIHPLVMPLVSLSRLSRTTCMLLGPFFFLSLFCHSSLSPSLFFCWRGNSLLSSLFYVLPPSSSSFPSSFSFPSLATCMTREPSTIIISHCAAQDQSLLVGAGFRVAVLAVCCLLSALPLPPGPRRGIWRWCARAHTRRPGRAGGSPREAP